uniref:Uncharacterized protein n=1 Tax=Oryza glumipatula TaxID=40148 RepID=A0A0E0AND5_9ORYZ
MPLSSLSLSPARRLDLAWPWPPLGVLPVPWPPPGVLPTLLPFSARRGSMLWMGGVLAAPSLPVLSLLRRRRRRLEGEAVGVGCGSRDFFAGGSGGSSMASTPAVFPQWVVGCVELGGGGSSSLAAMGEFTCRSPKH